MVGVRRVGCPEDKNWVNVEGVRKVLGVVPPNSLCGSDTMKWAHPYIESSVGDMYHSLKGEDGVREKAWSVLWRWKGPRRIQLFLWKAIHDGLPTFGDRLGSNLDIEANTGTWYLESRVGYYGAGGAGSRFEDGFVMPVIGGIVWGYIREIKKARMEFGKAVLLEEKPD
ncbi:hypothetical protein K1719_032904 [Acacia pycnantha]|nr:hypothetical protein K1719_032904 [Acacia pycnantha]